VETGRDMEVEAITEVTFADEKGENMYREHSLKTVNVGNTYNGMTVADIKVEHKPEGGYPTLTFIHNDGMATVFPDCRIAQYIAIYKR